MCRIILCYICLYNLVLNSFFTLIAFVVWSFESQASAYHIIYTSSKLLICIAPIKKLWFLVLCNSGWYHIFLSTREWKTDQFSTSGLYSQTVDWDIDCDHFRCSILDIIISLTQVSGLVIALYLLCWSWASTIAQSCCLHTATAHWCFSSSPSQIQFLRLQSLFSTMPLDS